MTTDNFTTAASAEAERWYPDLREDSRHEYGAEGFAVGAEWARTHLAAQELTEEMVDAAVAGREERGWFTSASSEDNRDEMRAIISDALTARRRDMKEDQ